FRCHTRPLPKPSMSREVSGAWPDSLRWVDATGPSRTHFPIRRVDPEGLSRDSRRHCKMSGSPFAIVSIAANNNISTFWLIARTDPWARTKLMMLECGLPQPRLHGLFPPTDEPLNESHWL